MAGAAGRARISERAYNHPMRTARGHHRAASGVAGRPWAREKRFRDALGVTDNGTYKLDDPAVSGMPEYGLLQPTQAQSGQKRLKSTRESGVLLHGPRPGPLPQQAR